MTGAWPPQFVDHENGVRDDNRWINLRLASPRQNIANIVGYASNTSGVRGVSWIPQSKKWGARIKSCGKLKHLGLFEDIESARQAYEAARIALHGDFALSAISRTCVKPAASGQQSTCIAFKQEA
jgi:hypothetical protein